MHHERNVIKMTYNHLEVEKNGKKYWEDYHTFKTDVWDFSKPKYYALDMFPYPSGQGLHVGASRGVYCNRYNIKNEKECKVIMFYILWDLILLAFLLNNMLLRLVIILQVLLNKILKLLLNN